MNCSQTHQSRDRRFRWSPPTFFILTIIVLLTTVSCASIEEYEKPLAVAHRGGAGVAPENTLSAFERALDHGPIALEIDIHMSSDGTLMVIHDPLLYRTTGLAGAVNDFDSSFLQTVNAAIHHPNNDFEPIPTLVAVLDLVESRSHYPVHYHIDLKLAADGSRYPGIEEQLIQLLRAYDLIDRTTVISFDFPTLETIGELEPSLTRGALLGSAYMTRALTRSSRWIANEMHRLGVDYVGVTHTFLSSSLFDQLRKRDIGVGTWTVNSARHIRKFAEMGVDFITSDYPELLYVHL